MNRKDISPHFPWRERRCSRSKLFQNSHAGVRQVHDAERLDGTPVVSDQDGRKRRVHLERKRLGLLRSEVGRNRRLSFVIQENSIISQINLGDILTYMTSAVDGERGVTKKQTKGTRLHELHVHDKAHCVF